MGKYCDGYDVPAPCTVDREELSKAPRKTGFLYDPLSRRNFYDNKAALNAITPDAKKGVKDRVYSIVGEKPISIAISVLDKEGGVLLHKPGCAETNTALLEAAGEASPYSERRKVKRIATDRPTQDLFRRFSSTFRNLPILSIDPVHIVMAIGSSYLKGTRGRKTECAMMALTSAILASSASKEDSYFPISELPHRALFASAAYIVLRDSADQSIICSDLLQRCRQKPPAPLQSLSEYTESAYAIINEYSVEASKRTTRGRTIKELLESHVMSPATMAFLWNAVVNRSGLRCLDTDWDLRERR